MNIVISLSSDKYIEDIINFEIRVRQKWQNKLKLIVFIDDVNHKITRSLNYVHFQKNYVETSVENLSNAYDIIENYSSIIDTNLFKSDLRLSSGILSINEMIIKQASLTTLIYSKVSNNNFLSFSFGGTNIIHSILFKISEYNGIYSYRIHNAINLESEFKINRLWFSPNNRMLLNHNQPLFNHNQVLLNDKVDLFVDNLINGVKRETLSKQFVSRRYPNSFKLFFQEFIKLFILLVTFDKRFKKYYFRFKLFFNSLIIRFLHYNLPINAKPYILFALNVPTDSQILVRAPYFKDFIPLIALISDSIPLNHNLVIREHPAFPGMLDYFELKQLLKRKKNVKFVSHNRPFFELLKNAKSLLIINNTSFMESIILGIPVIGIGKGVFSNQKILNEITDFSELSNAFSNYNDITSIKDFKFFLKRWYAETYPVIGSDSEKFVSKIELTLNGIIEKIDSHLNTN